MNLSACVLWLSALCFGLLAGRRLATLSSAVWAGIGPAVIALGIATAATLNVAPHGSIDATAAGVALGAVIVCAWTDLRVGAIFDDVTVPALLVIVLLSTAKGGELFAFAGAVATSGALYALHLATRGRGMGLGDVKLAAVIGACLGASIGLVALGVAFVVGAALGVFRIAVGAVDRTAEIRFAPFLAAGTGVACLLYGAR